MSEEQGDLQAWRQKYYNLLGDLEEKERQWSEVEQVLRHGLNRLSLAVDNSDEMLNRQLETLRGAIRAGRASAALRVPLEAISSSLLRLDEARKSQVEGPAPPEVLQELLDRIVFPRGMGHRASALKKRLGKAAADEFASLVEEFVTLVGDALEWATGAEGTAEDEGKRGLLGKLFKGKGEEASASIVEVAASELQLAKSLLGDLIRSLVDEEERRNSLTEQLYSSEQEAQLRRLGDELAELLRGMGGSAEISEGLPVNEVLVRLLERLDIPAELTAEVEAVKAMLLRTLPAEELEQVIVAIAELIAEMRSRMQSEKAELENFLKQLTTRLQEIDIGFQSNVETQRESFRDGRALDDAVKQQVAGIEESVQQAEELDALKSLVQQRVDAIRNHMQEFRQAEERRLQQAEQQVAELTKKLTTVQGESDKLRERLQNERNQAMVDPLTGIPNRLAYNERMQQEFARWQRYGSPLSIAVWDVDKFKSVNDTYGHQAGDKVLSVIGKVLNKQCRDTDFVARFGGEEFVLLLPETGLDNALVAAEHLRKAVEATEFHFRGKRVPITISCGISAFGQGDTPEVVFERADKALYEAKHGGRNRCCKG